ncbi:DUF2542 family protein [Salmonella enterica subsp. enterica]|nr:DUF2542 family protein [Salmonella enterica subsp. enterica]
MLKSGKEKSGNDRAGCVGDDICHISLSATPLFPREARRKRWRTGVRVHVCCQNARKPVWRFIAMLYPAVQYYSIFFLYTGCGFIY